MAEALVALVAAAALVPAGLRWLRVAQREHYVAGSVARFAGRWWKVDWLNTALAIAGVIALGVAVVWPWAALGTATVIAVGPIGLGVRGTSSKLAWTRRLRAVAGVTVGLIGLAALGGLAFGRVGWAVAAAGQFLPRLMDLALLLLKPVERRLGRTWVGKARTALDRVDPIRVAITGSYGKTTTKEFTRQVLGSRFSVVASPASFNNAMGLARAVNEHLSPGTQVFIAEMGTYGAGEIADMVGWVRPNVAVMTSIGPVHLERFGSLEAVAAAKSEILSGVDAAVISIDQPLLAAAADRAEAAGTRVVRCSVGNSKADVCVLAEDGGMTIHVAGDVVAEIENPPEFPANVACAVGVAVALDMPLDGVAGALSGAAGPDHRQTVLTAEAGFTVIDDTYNSNPAGAASALALLTRHGKAAGRRVVVTPGMVELGKLQDRENAAFAAAASSAATDVVIVGRANRKALLAGAATGPASVTTVADRDEAVDWVRSRLGPSDVVLYENDLPDHYP